ncbi:DUF3667 domain-containing protein [Croceiramulus getboli]|nr:DUF3667 domain-containing protein [Flavobacteriaceae bacterium YJPT1-3]
MAGALVTIDRPDRCLNCENPILPQAQYCLGCGAKVQEYRFTTKRLVNEFSERFLNVDNTIFKTYIHLFTQPEAVIDGFLHGLRKRYLNAFNYFAVAITLSGIMLFFMKRFFPEAMEFDFGGLPEDQINPQMESIMEYQSLLYFATVPILALLGWAVWKYRKEHNYAEQLIIQLYTYSHCAINAAILGVLLLFSGLPWMTISMFLTPFYVLYNAYVYKRLYQLPFSEITARTLIFILIGVGSYIGLIFLGIVCTLLYFFITQSGPFAG